MFILVQTKTGYSPENHPPSSRGPQNLFRNATERVQKEFCVAADFWNSFRKFLNFLWKIHKLKDSYMCFRRLLNFLLKISELATEDWWSCSQKPLKFLRQIFKHALEDLSANFFVDCFRQLNNSELASRSDSKDGRNCCRSRLNFLWRVSSLVQMRSRLVVWMFSRSPKGLRWRHDMYLFQKLSRICLLSF